MPLGAHKGDVHEICSTWRGLLPILLSHPEQDEFQKYLLGVVQGKGAAGANMPIG
jgi:hypothetical protein